MVVYKSAHIAILQCNSSIKYNFVYKTDQNTKNNSMFRGIFGSFCGISKCLRLLRFLAETLTYVLRNPGPKTLS